MIKIKEAIVVEGKYDKIRLSSFIDAVIIVTDGFGIFKDKEKLALVRYYAETTGIVILTDSDKAGFIIRNHIKGAVKKGIIKNVYIPDIFGKEKRKLKPSAEGKLGVEGISNKILTEAFEKAGISTGNTAEDSGNKITKTDLYLLGLSGGSGSSELRRRLLSHLNLPTLLSANSMLEVLNTMMNKEELERLMTDNFGRGE